jgi:hypothetical protein
LRSSNIRHARLRSLERKLSDILSSHSCVFLPVFFPNLPVSTFHHHGPPPTSSTTCSQAIHLASCGAFQPQLALVLMASLWLVSPMNSCDIRQTKAPDYFGPFAVFEQARLMVDLILLHRVWSPFAFQQYHGTISFSLIPFDRSCPF